MMFATSPDERQSLPNLKIVADTNFYIAAAIKDGYARSYLMSHAASFMSYKLYSSEAILLEVQRVLEATFEFDRSLAVRVTNSTRKHLTIVYPSRKIELVRDADDNKILECAAEVTADIIVSSDKDLLTLKEFENIKIIHPSDLKYLLPLP